MPPHHHHYRLHHRYPTPADKYPADLLDRRRPPNTRYQVENDSLSPGRLNRVADAPNHHDIVERWLGEVVAHTPRPPPGSPGFRGEATPSPRHRAQRDTMPLNGECSERVDSAWRPHRILPMKTSHSPLPLYPIHERSSKRSKHRRNDSSLISGFENSAKPPDCDFVSTSLHERERTSPNDPWGEEHRSILGGSPPASHVDKLDTFEKRPRRKTREDKYDQKKKAGRKHEITRGGEDEPDRPRKRCKRAEKRRKPAIPSKNVMNNFTSDAVMNDRITVQPTFKPGLFDNGRLSKGKPIPDLAFSEMQFLKHQKRDSQPKPLSKHRLRERRRENREVEQVSSFFLPSKKETKHRELSKLSRGNNQHTMNVSRRNEHRQGYISQQRPISSELSSDHYNGTAIRQPSPSSSRNDPYQLPANNVSNSEYRKGSSKPTTCFTWSSSHPSPRIYKPNSDKGSYFSRSISSVTPELVRKSLIATGDHTTHDEVSTNRLNSNQKECHNKSQREVCVSPGADSRVEATLGNEDSETLKQRWNSILPPELRSERDFSSGDNVGAKGCPNSPMDNERPIVIESRESTGCQNCVKTSRAHAKIHGADSSIIQANSSNYTENRDPNPLKQGDTDCGQISRSHGGISQTSREVMPPPPLPTSKNKVTNRDKTSEGEYPSNTPEDSRPSDNPQAEIWGSLGNMPAQHLANLDGNQNVSTLPLRSTINTEDPGSTLQPISWIPQTRTPSIVNDERCGILSRMSMKTPIYISQLDEKPRTISAPSQLLRSQSNEDISEFIARIEREADEQNCLEHYALAGLETDTDKALLNSPVTHIETYDHRLIHPSTELQGVTQEVPSDTHLEYEIPRLSCPLVGGYNTEIFMTNGHNIEPLGLSQPAGQSGEDLDNERLEMSRFWRPNYYSQF
ncbi:hypothetical protein F4810DRAFT_570643 [Camillea tinctor]|nr:hypothetical protein F4810DRAFT_570643 [Camillea tinctor]